MIKAKQIVLLFLLALQEGWGYIWGAAGEVWTQKDQDKATRQQIVKYGQKWVGKHVADCSGLFRWAFKKLGGYMYHGSNTMWSKYMVAKGKLLNGKRDDGKTLKPGTAVFKVKNITDYYHVGLYVGNGEVVEAQGTPTGVVKSRITSWHCWGEMKGVDYSAEETADVQQTTDTQTPADTSTDETYVVKRNDSLWKIAKRYYGEGVKYKAIMKANNLKSEVIRIGMVLTIPKA